MDILSYLLVSECVLFIVVENRMKEIKLLWGYKKIKCWMTYLNSDFLIMCVR